MPTILKIGYKTFLVERAGDAAAVVKAMAGAVPLDSKRVSRKEVFWPSDDVYGYEIAMATIRPDQLRASEPPDADVTVSQQQLLIGNGGAR